VYVGVFPGLPYRILGKIITYSPVSRPALIRFSVRSSARASILVAVQCIPGVFLVCSWCILGVFHGLFHTFSETVTHTSMPHRIMHLALIRFSARLSARAQSAWNYLMFRISPYDVKRI
jgi:hypothetical protein